MAITNFQQTIWCHKIQKALETITSLKDHCDFQYERDAENADKVKILGVVRPTIGTYVPNTDITIANATDASQTLLLDQFRYFAFQVDSVDRVQGVPGLIEALSAEAVQGLSEEGDKYVASVVVAGVTGGTIDKLASTKVSTLTDGGVKMIGEAFTKLYENNCKVTDKYYLEITPALFNEFRTHLQNTLTNNVAELKSGAVGYYNNALVSIENLLGTWNDGTRNCKLAMLRTGHAVAFCDQINEVKATEMEKRFNDLIKGLYVFGAKVVRPEQIVCMPLY